MIKIFGHPVSTCTRKVLMTLNETKTPYELQTIDFAKAEHKGAEHVARQPFGQVPTLNDDGFALYESRAIARYIAEKAKSALVPADLKTRAIMEQWISVETSNFTPHAMKFIYSTVFQRPQEPAVLEAAGKSLDHALGVFDAALAKSPYFAGGDFSLADIVYMPYFEYALMTPAKEIFARHAHAMAWWKRASERPTWQKTLGKG